MTYQAEDYKIQSFTQLQAWQMNHRLVLAVYDVCNSLHQYSALRNQIERSALSITSNIAEGFGRQSIADKRHFYVMARGSAYELQNQLLVLRGTQGLTKDQFDTIAQLSVESLRLLHGLIRSTRERTSS